MGTNRILIVEDDPDSGNMLRTYFENQGFEVSLATRGEDALIQTRHRMPHLIVLDIILPDMDGYEVCRSLRASSRTAHIPILFLTQKDERKDRIAGLELGADDYLIKPFDIEELRLRVLNAITRTERESMADPRTGLPASRQIENCLRQNLTRTGWALLDCRLLRFDSYREAYGAVAGDEILRFAAGLLVEIVEEIGAPDDFIGHPGGDSFIILTEESRAIALEARLTYRINKEIPEKYSYLDRERGFSIIRGASGAETHVPLMQFSVTALRSSENHFTDVRQITEAAAALRRQSI